MTTTDDELEAFLVNLEIMSLAALRAEWQTRWERPPVLRSPRLLRHLIAWRIQAAAYGDLTWDDRGCLKLASLPTLQTLKEGSRVAREYLGVIHEVVAEPDGFRYRERHYRSLSAIAREITGVRWNGPRFFGLRAGVGRGAA